MIDWASVGIGALWITCLAIIFATISCAHWRAGERGERLRAVLGVPGCQVALDLGMVLLCTGLFFTARSTWERLAWAALALLSSASALGQCHAQRKGETTQS